MSQNERLVRAVKAATISSKPTFNENNESATVVNLSDLWKRIQCMFSHLYENLEAKIQSCLLDLERRIAGLKRQLADMKCEWDTNVNTLSQSLNVMRSDVDRNTQHLSRLENSQDLVITGIPYRQGEDLNQIFRKIADTLGVHVDKLSLVKMHRLSRIPVSPESSAPILCQFAFRRSRDDFFRFYLRDRSLTLHDIGYDSNKRVYINESLTLQARNILRAAINLRKDGRLHKVFTKNGEVSVMVRRDGDAETINSIGQLSSIFNTTLSI